MSPDRPRRLKISRRLRDWNDAGVRQRLHGLLRAELGAANLLDFSPARSTPVTSGR
jgi:hypothetical protein